MRKGFLSYFLSLAVSATAFIFSGCNSSDTWGTDPQDLSGTAVTGFSLKADKAVLNNLDSVYFSIDLVEARIFNASPLPYGTKTDAIAVSISSDACSVAQLYVTGNEEKEDAVIDYLASPDEKIDFSNGPVKLHLVSADGQHERDYEICVNVASEVADSLYWDKMQGGRLHGVAGMAQAKTVKSGDKAIMLSVSRNGKAAISTFIPAPKTGGGNWEASLTEPVFTSESVDVNGTSGATPASTINVASILNVDTFTATQEGFLYVTDYNGNLYVSTDNGRNFHLADNGWEYITAPYLDTVLGIKNNAGARSFASYSVHTGSSVLSPMQSDFPVSGTSGAATFATKWASRPQIVITGGKTSSGNFTRASWAFDGDKWAKVSEKLPAGAGWAMSKYLIAETDTATWRVRQREVLIAFGGLGLKPQTDVWISRDMGVNWQKGSKLLQLPEYIPFTTGGSLLVFDKTLEAADAAPLAVKPITSWECPYLYLFGGCDISGNLLDSYWSGAVNHLKLKPLQ